MSLNIIAAAAVFDAGLYPLSPCGRGRGPARSAGRVRGPRAQDLADALEHTLRIPQYLVVPEAEHLKPLALEKARPDLIALNFESMLPAIDLDCEPMGEADKIHNISTYR